VAENRFLQRKAQGEVKQLTRLTFVCNDPKFVHQICSLLSGNEKKHLAVILSYDILALRTSSEVIFDQACTKSDVDLISLDFSQKLNFYIQKSQVKQAIKNGISFEICYGEGALEEPANRKVFLQNCI